MPSQMELGLQPAKAQASPTNEQVVYERPQKRLEQLGSRALSLQELLAIVVGAGMADNRALLLAQQLLVEVGPLPYLAMASTQELMQLPGITQARAVRVQAALELGRRLMKPDLSKRYRIAAPADAANLLIPDMAMLEQEQIRTILLNTRQEVIGLPTIYVGSVNTTTVRIGELFRDAIRQNATALILGHNHPSGDPTPSPEDVRVTREVVSAGQLLGIEVQDHLIVGGGKYVSLRERGLGF